MSRRELWRVEGRDFVAGFIIDQRGQVIRSAPILRRRGSTLRQVAGSIRQGEGLERVDAWDEP